MLFYYVQDVYQKNYLGTRLDKDKHDPSRKASVASIEKLRKVLDSKNHLDWLKMDLNLAKKITV